MSLLVHYKILGSSETGRAIQQEGNAIIEEYEIKGLDPGTALLVLCGKVLEYCIVYKNWHREESVITNVVICNVITWPSVNR